MHQSTVPMVPSTLDASVTLPSDIFGLSIVVFEEE
jgi:hypothetical protein